ncbi:MAG: 4Fe-4S binding protein, partial [Gemmatimonadetes bacterium]|nr:4Fe-4S binding protein [Gemmatimonadota bacterium]
MKIDHQKCVACGNCVAVCPMGAIYIDRSLNRATVNTDE